MGEYEHFKGKSKYFKEETNKRVRHFVAQTNKRKKIPQFCELLRNSYAQFKLTLSDRQKMAPRG